MSTRGFRQPRRRDCLEEWGFDVSSPTLSTASHTIATDACSSCSSSRVRSTSTSMWNPNSTQSSRRRSRIRGGSSASESRSTGIGGSPERCALPSRDQIAGHRSEITRSDRVGPGARVVLLTLESKDADSTGEVTRTVSLFSGVAQPEPAPRTCVHESRSHGAPVPAARLSAAVRPWAGASSKAGRARRRAAPR